MNIEHRTLNISEENGECSLFKVHFVMLNKRALLQIHFCVVLWGFTPILGKAITLGAIPLVWWRMVIVTSALFLLPRFWKGLRTLPPRMLANYVSIGVVVAAHWLTFYGSIKLANASVAATCMGLVALFTAFLEPFFMGGKFRGRELIFGAAVIPGVALVVGGVPTLMRAGLAMGAASAFLAAVFGLLNKRFVDKVDPLTITGVEMAAGAAFLTIAAPLFPAFEPVFVRPDGRDALLLLALALACTLLPFALSLVALRHLSVFTTAIAVNMEPVYAIFLAIVLFGEQRELSLGFYAGVAIVLAVVFLHPLLMRRTFRQVS
jgi:drug/metabolite transporter (DMT)-like permease